MKFSATFFLYDMKLFLRFFSHSEDFKVLVQIFELLFQVFITKKESMADEQNVRFSCFIQTAARLIQFWSWSFLLFFFMHSKGFKVFVHIFELLFQVFIEKESMTEQNVYFSFSISITRFSSTKNPRLLTEMPPFHFLFKLPPS